MRMFEDETYFQVNLSVNLNKPIIPLLMEKMDWPPKGSMGPIFSEYLFIRFFQRGGEETPDRDQRYWPIPKFQELLMQLNYFVVPDQKMVQKGMVLTFLSLKYVEIVYPYVWSYFAK